MQHNHTNFCLSAPLQVTSSSFSAAGYMVTSCVAQKTTITTKKMRADREVHCCMDSIRVVLSFISFHSSLFLMVLPPLSSKTTSFLLCPAFITTFSMYFSIKSCGMWIGDAFSCTLLFSHNTFLTTFRSCFLDWIAIHPQCLSSVFIPAHSCG